MPMIITLAADASNLTDMQQKLIVGLASAFVGVFGTLLAYFLKSRREPRRKVSYDSATEPGLGGIDPKLRDKLRISYAGTHVEDLYSAHYRIANSGNSVVKNQRVRFSIPDDVRLLELILAPEPEPELKVQRSPESSRSQIIYTIGQLERGEEVSFGLVLDGKNAPQWRVKTSNEEGDVDVAQRGAQRNIEDRAHVVPFLTSVFFFLFLPPAISGFMLYEALSDALTSLIRLAFLIFCMIHLLPTLRLVRETFFSGDKAGRGHEIEGDAYIFNDNTFNGGVTWNPEARQNGMGSGPRQ
ncbi:hypothetical protein [Streptomyces angustmyceticus]|uniref:hypothetical protein n=1 Tax=Streptomyces angustmyceticus TaxID=285578 RepID=UPI0021AE35E7|nr:hypothetical protein [Streptomyces angustmyceticus]